MITTQDSDPITINETNELVSEQDSLKPTTQRSLRSLAFHILYSADRNNYDQPLSFVLDDFREGFEVNFADDCFAVVMVRGVLEHQKRLMLKSFPFCKIGLLSDWDAARC